MVSFQVKKEIKLHLYDPGWQHNYEEQNKSTQAA